MPYTTPIHPPGLRHIVIRSTRPAPSRDLIGFSATATQRPPQDSRFLEIPVDILLLISEELDGRCEISRLARTCIACYKILNPILYLNDARFGESLSLICGAATGVLNTVKLAYIYGADLNIMSQLILPGLPRIGAVTGEFFTTALHWAAKTNRLEVAKWLVDHGADIEKLAAGMCSCRENYDPASQRSFDSPWTALHIAICRGKVQTAQALIAHGASLMVSNDRLLHTALHSAARVGNLRIIKFMAANSLIDDINQGDRVGNTALHHLAALRGDSATDQVLSMLLNLGADIEKVNTYGCGPLVYACQKRNFSLARHLLARGANPNPAIPTTHRVPGPLGIYDSQSLQVPVVFRYTSFNPTKLHPLFSCVDELLYADWAEISTKASKRALYFLRELLNKGADVDDRQVHNGHCTSLMLACLRKKVMVVRELIQAGASVNAEDQSGRRPMEYLPISRDERPDSKTLSIIAILIRHGAQPGSQQGNADLKVSGFELMKQLRGRE